MDLECADSIYVEATINRTIELRTVFKNDSGINVLTTEEARTLANALLAAVVEAEAYVRQPVCAYGCLQLHACWHHR